MHRIKISIEAVGCNLRLRKSVKLIAMRISSLGNKATAAVALHSRVLSLHGRVLSALALLLGCVVAPALGQESPSAREPILITDLLKLQQIGSVAVSPDSREVLYTVTSIADADLSEDRDSLVYRTHVYLVDAAGTYPPRQLTRGDESARDPAWHPDGDRIAFVRNVDGTPQIFELPLLGGEAIQVTDLESGASNPQWSPDGSRILFASSLSEEELSDRLGHGPDWPIERPGRTWADADNARPDPNGSLSEIRAWLEDNADDGNPLVLHRLDFHGEHDLQARPEFRHFFVMRVDTVDAPTMITQGFNHFGDAQWLPDGERVVVSGTVQDESHPDRTIDSHLYLARADGSGISPLLEMDGLALYEPVPSPDGQQIVFLASDEADRGYAQRELGILPTDAAGNARLLTLDFDRSVSDPKWSKDGWYVYFTAPSDGGVPLYRVHPFARPDRVTSAETLAADTASAQAPSDSIAAADTAVVSSTTAAADTAAVSGPTAAADTATTSGVPATDLTGPTAEPSIQIDRLTSFERGIRSYSPGRATVFFVATAVENPYELYSSNLQFTSESRITSHNADWLEDKILSYPERHSLTRDGREIDYWIMRPTAFDSSRRYPLLVQIHGGPSAMWGPGEETMWHEFQFFASKGYGIVFANPRGSGGYGYDFERANYQNWGAGPAGDVLAVATEAASLPWVDADRQVVTGGSYAGYLTAWIVAHDDRFKAAAAQRGVYDLDTFLGEGNAWRLVPLHFGGYPWDTEAPAVEITPASDSVDMPPVGEETGPRDSAAALDVAADSIGAAADSAATVTGADSLRASTDVPLLSPAEILVKNSPLSFVEQITTPLLIMHADNDLRTGVIQSEMLYRALKVLERPVEYVRYPDAGHDLSRTGDPRQRMDRILRIYEFFERFIR